PPKLFVGALSIKSSYGCCDNEQRRQTLHVEHHARHAFAEPQAVVLAAILGIDVSHVRQEYADKWRAMRWQGLNIIGRDDRLGKRRAKHPALLDPARVDIGSDGANSGHVAIDHVLIGLAEERVIHRQIVPEI